MKLLEGKVVLITGAGSGMGQTHAEVMAERGEKMLPMISMRKASKKPLAVYKQMVERF